MSTIRLRKKFYTSSLLLSCLVNFAAKGGEDPNPDEVMQYDQTRPILSLHGPARQNAVADLNTVLVHLFQADGSAGSRPFVLYVHGRGDEPHKSFHDSTSRILRRTPYGKGQVLAKIEEDGVAVLGFNWNSYADDKRCGRPIDEARKSGPALAAIVHGLLESRKTDAALWEGRPTVLLVHSMGGFVLQSAMQDPVAGEDIKAFFDVRVISDSDVPAKGHVTWVPAGPPGQTVVLTNPNDATLKRSLKCDRRAHNISKADQGPRLGLLSTAAQERAPGVTYVVLDVGDTHRTFTQGGSNGNVDACKFVLSLMRGHVPEMDRSWRANVDGDRVVHIIRRRVSDSACGLGVRDDDGGD